MNSYVIEVIFKYDCRQFSEIMIMTKFLSMITDLQLSIINIGQ